MMAVALGAMAAITSCQDDIDAPEMKVPVATLTPNITIADLKAMYWEDDNNYIKQITPTESGERLVVAGRVISDDAAGNIFRNLIIQDETAALQMSIYSYNLYLNYRVGQEIVMDLTDMYIGKYSTIQQLGYPEYAAAYGWQPSFMPTEFFEQHRQLNGMPEISKIDTLTVNISDLSNDKEAMLKYESQLVRLNNVHFEEGGKAAFCTAHKVPSTDRILIDANNQSIEVRTSGYANFWGTMLPEGDGDVVGIVTSYYNNKEGYKWRLQIRSTDDLLNFGNPTLPKGSETNPYSVDEAIAMIKAEAPKSGWFTGYIVGSLKAGVQTVESADDIVWGADAELNNTLVIGQNAQANTLENAMLLRLPQDSPLRQYGNLLDVPENYLKQIWVLATPGTEIGMNAFTGNTGTTKEFRIEGLEIPDTPTPGGEGDPIAEGSGTETSPYNPTQVLAMGKNVNTPAQWVSGYIVGYVADKALSSAVMGATGDAVSETNILIATSIDETDYTKCVPVQLPFGDVRSALNLKANPGNYLKKVDLHGDLIAYFGVAGVKNTDQYKLEGAGDTPTPPPSGEVVTSINENFEGGTTIPAGWSNIQTSGNASWFIRTYNSNNSAEVTGYNKTAGSNGFQSWLVTPGLNVDAMENKTLSFKSMVGYNGNGTLEVYVLTSADPATAQATKLNANIPSPTGTWSENWVESGVLSLDQFSGTVYIGFLYSAEAGSNYTTYRIDEVVTGETSQGGGDDPVTPPTPGSNSVNFSIFGDKSNAYSDREAEGWVAKWCALAIGGADNPNAAIYPFLPDENTFALVIDGSPKRMGSLTSPTLTGGVSKVTLNYGFAFTDKKCSFTVNIKQNGEVVATQTETIESIEKNKVYDFTMDCSVQGDFVIEILNNAYSQASGNNADRVAVWNLTWDN